jgi:hypothetical protein
MDPFVQSSLRRRSLIRIGVTAAAAAVLGSAVAPGIAEATLPTSPKFNLTAAEHHLFGPKLMHESHHGIQGFTFDDVNRRLFVVQAQNKGSGADLVVNQVSAAGKVLGSMVVKGAGHGVSIAAEPVGKITYIWIECDANKNDKTGRGTALARVQFKNMTRTSIASSAKFFRGSNSITAAVDPINKRLMIRRKESGTWYLSVWPLSKARDGKAADRLVHIKQPSYGRTFQGYTFYGQYAYLFYGDGQTDPAKINSTIRRLDLNTGKFDGNPYVTKAGKSLNYREPEGMAVHKMDNGRIGLFFGFSSHQSGGGDNRYANLYYKLL